MLLHKLQSKKGASLSMALLIFMALPFFVVNKIRKAMLEYEYIP